MTLSADDEARHLRNLARNRAKAKAARAGQSRRRDRFVMVPLKWAEQATRATNSQGAFVWIWLLHLAWKAKSHTVTLANAQLEASGISRKVKMRALRDLERAGLIRVERRSRKSPLVTLLHS
jgi:hypothetical protein